MKYLITLICFVLIKQFCFSQITFERGYFINNENDRIDCFIKNVDWKNNPTSFKYRTSKSGTVRDNKMSEVQEFGIEDKFKYIRCTVDIDQTGVTMVSKSSARNPIFERKQLFLQVVLEGELSLYSFQIPSAKWFFYKLEEGPYIQLQYKWYGGEFGRPRRQNAFRQQIQNALRCGEIAQRTIDRLSYAQHSLEPYFANFNTCRGSENIVFSEKEEKRDDLHLTFRIGIKNASFRLTQNMPTELIYDFESQFLPRIGIALEYTLPFNQDKWTLIIDPSFEYFKGESVGRLLTARIDYKSIEIPIGLRHYFFLNGRNKIFLNATYNLNFDVNSFVFLNEQPILKSTYSGNIAVGAGLQLNRTSLEFRYNFTRNLLPLFAGFTSEYNSISVLAGYRFL